SVDLMTGGVRMNKKRKLAAGVACCLGAVLLAIGLGGGQLDPLAGGAKADARAVALPAPGDNPPGAGDFSNPLGHKDPPLQPTELSPEAMHAAWVKSSEPPKPAITVDGIALETTSPGYSWCRPADDGSDESVCMVACGALPAVLPTATVAAGSEIAIREPEGI